MYQSIRVRLSMSGLFSVVAACLCFSFVTSDVSAEGTIDCGYNWNCWNMYDYEDVPVWINNDSSSPGHYDPSVPSPVLIYLHSNGPYGPLGPRENGGVQEEDYWLRLWCESDDGHDYYKGLKHWTVEYEPPSGGTPQETGWIYVLPNGAADKPANQTCSDAGDWAGWRYWNGTPNCCAYNWYVEGSYTEVSSEAPDHLSYINGLIGYLKLNYNVDSDRVYIYGYSNGGYMAHALACHNGDYAYYGATPQAIAAIGTYAGVTYMNPENCYGLWPTNVLHTHDIGDTECLYNGGIDQAFAGECYPGYPRPYPGAIATVSSWIFLNQTESTGHILEPVQPFDLNVPYSTAQVIDWPDGRYGSRVQHWRGIFGSHFASFSNNYRNRLVQWFLNNPRPDYQLYEPCLGDYDEDGNVDANDILSILNLWDDPYGVDDILVVIKAWGGCEA